MDVTQAHLRRRGQGTLGILFQEELVGRQGLPVIAIPIICLGGLKERRGSGLSFFAGREDEEDQEERQGANDEMSG